MAFQLLKCLAKALAKHGGKFVCEVISAIPGAETLSEIAADTFEDYRRVRQEDALRAEVQALAQATTEQVRQEVQGAVQAEAGHLPADVQRNMVAYLTQVPAMIRRSLRRPSDATGSTVPPSLALRRPEDLLPFLPPRAPRFKPGDRPLPGVDWVLEEPLGVGGFGEVWKARHAHLTSKAPVALKFCLDASAVPVLRNEAGILDQVMRHGRHAGIVPLLQTYLSADPPCLEYEYVEGGDLASLIQELHTRGKALTATANRVLLRLAEIVAFAHRASPPIVHGDLKPANILVGRGAKGELSLRVTDFGIGGLAALRAASEARQPTRSRQQLLTEVVRGAYTPLYACPEQMTRRRGEAADPRDDVHALGVIWYQLVTGDLGMLTVPTDWREQLEKHGLVESLIKLLAACIAPKAERRPASAAVLAEVLAAELQAREVSPGKPVAPAAQPALAQPALTAVRPSPTPVLIPQRAVSFAGPSAASPVSAGQGHHPPEHADNPQLQQLRQGMFLNRLKQLLGLHAAAARQGRILLVILGGILFGVPAGTLLGNAVWRRDFSGALVVFLAIVGFTIFSLLFWQIGKWRRRARSRSLDETIQQLLQEHPQDVQRWGGLAVLRGPFAVQEVIRLLEGKNG